MKIIRNEVRDDKIVSKNQGTEIWYKDMGDDTIDKIYALITAKLKAKAVEINKF
jgi:hypothetical protein